MWLDDLRDLAYDVEDILDELATQASECTLVIGHQTYIIPACFTSLGLSADTFNANLVSKIKGISSQLDELFELKTELGLEKIAGGTSTAAYRRLPSTSVPMEPAVYGREKGKARILEMVLKNEPNDANFGVIPIVGMGGVGKTVLAREVFNDKVVEDFNPRAWVCISDDFDVLRISKAILETITLSTCDLKDLNAVQVKLKDAVGGRKFLLVLDDVWSKNYELWEALKSPFMACALGSRIIVTTRRVDVVLTMEPGGYYGLKLLSDDDCWSVFVKHAFKSRDISTLQNSELIYKKVVEKCKGLPLAARTLGGLLCSKKIDDEWDEILSSKIWDLSDETDILPVLKLSCHHLPSHLKRFMGVLQNLLNHWRLYALKICKNGSVGTQLKKMSRLRDFLTYVNFPLKCPKLSGKLPNHLPSLEKLVILDCVQLVVSLKSLPLLCKLEIDGCKEVECISLTVSKSLISIKLSNVSETGNWLRQEFHKVNRLKVVRCENHKGCTASPSLES